MDQTDLYLARARGALDATPQVTSIVNPDLEFDSLDRLAKMSDHARVATLPLASKLSPLSIVVAWPLMAQIQFTDDGVALGQASNLFVAFMLSLSVVLFVGMLGVLAASWSRTRQLATDPAMASVREAGNGDYLTDVPGAYGQLHTLFLRSVDLMNSLDLDVESTLALEDLRRQEHLLLRSLKHETDPAAQAATGSKLEALVLQTTALAYAWQDRRAGEKAQLEQALVEETIDVEAMVRRVVADSPATNPILKPIEEVHRERA